MAQPRTPTRRSRPRFGCFTIYLGLLAISVLIAIIRSDPALGVVLLLAVGAAIAIVVARRQEQKQQARAEAAEARRIAAQRSMEVAPYHAMSAREFERALAFLCERDGCINVRVVGGAGDLGADVIATVPDGRRIVIQAKRYGPSTTVGSGDVQKVNGTYRDAHHAQLAVIITTSRFTKPAREYAQQVGIRTFDQHALAGWVSRTGPGVLIARRRPEPPPRANQTRIAVLEQDLYGIQPEPGTMAALAIGLRQASPCIRHIPVQRLGGHLRGAVCAGCGRALLMNDDGNWEIA